MAVALLNGSAFYPSNIQETITRIGTGTVARNGTRRFQHRGFKRRFDLTWKDAPESVLIALRTIAVLTTTFAFVHTNGVSYTVQCEDDVLQADVAFVGAGPGGAPVLYYSIKLTLYEA